MLAVRLIGVGAIVFLGPGLALLRRWRLPLEWPERIVIAFALSYGWVFLLSVVLPLVRAMTDVAAVLSLGLIAVAMFSAGIPSLSRRMPFRVDAVEGLLVVGIVAIAASTWFIESAMSGEEALDLASISRFADGWPISFTNTSLLPDTRPVYL